MSIPNIDNFYASYASKVLLRPGYPARAQYKSTLMWTLFGKQLKKYAGNIENYADVGGCFGFGAYAMAYHIFQNQGYPPHTKVFELSRDFIKLGEQLFPSIEFLQQDFTKYMGQLKVFDLVTLFDVIEHIENPIVFLRKVSTRTRFFLLKTPMETWGEWKNNKPLAEGGINHPDGHVNFFTPKSYLNMLNESGIEVLESKLVHSIVKPWLIRVLAPEELYVARKKSVSVRTFFGSIARKIIDTDIIPYKYFRFYWGGGDHLSLAKSKYYS